jgi:predicted MPP superfamily phosphohydrolase
MRWLELLIKYAITLFIFSLPLNCLLWISGQFFWAGGHLVLGLILLYASWIERHWLIVRLEKVESLKLKKAHRLALISDLHLGVYKSERFLKKVLKQIEGLSVEGILIAGDLINNPSRRQLETMFRPFKEVKVPIWAVTGNHDDRAPGSFTAEEINRELRKVGVRVVDDVAEKVELSGEKMSILGWSDWSGKRYRDELLFRDISGGFRLLLVHNPDVTYYLPEGAELDLVICGHTHGGQLNLPGKRYYIPSVFDFDRGWYQVAGRRVYVSSGLGEVLLPLRLGRRPEIVILDLLPGED